MKKPLRTPLFQQVADILRKEITVMPPGARLETDQGLARRFSVSVSVVREAISTLRRDCLLDRHVGRGTFVVQPKAKMAEAMSSSDSPKPVAILCDLDLLKASSSTLQKTSRPSLLRRVQEAKVCLERRGIETAIYLGDHAPSPAPPDRLTCRQFLKDLDRNKFGGVLAVWAFPHEEWVSKLRENGVPLVGFGLLHEKMVSYDFEAFIRLALKALKARNRTKIAYINGVSEWNLDDYDRERRKLVMSLFREAGVEVHEDWFKQDWHSSILGAGWSQFREVWTHKADRPDGLVIGAPKLWPEVQHAIDSFKLEIPGDLDVVLPTENPLNENRIIQIPFNLSAMIAEAVELLADLMEGKAPLETRRLINAWEMPVTTSTSVSHV